MLCTKCGTGYYLDKGVCLTCGPGCATCTSAAKCESCSAGYFLNGTKCTSCGVDNCNKCTKAKSCDSCVNGYYPKTNRTTVTC